MIDDGLYDRIKILFLLQQFIDAGRERIGPELQGRGNEFLYCGDEQRYRKKKQGDTDGRFQYLATKHDESFSQCCQRSCTTSLLNKFA
ncbi:hypothetical protein UNDYM_3880 [Undibacterium sp. YM2]|nr:hypothetical protein UNDYM_3880 [Undibacterium sp. YM2]